MPVYRSASGGAAWMLVTLLALTSGAAAQQSRRLPILVGGLQQGAASGPRALPPCSQNLAIPTAIKKTLIQMGEEIRDWPASIAPEQCTDVACAGPLRGVVREGYLLGGQIFVAENEPAHLDLWLIDLGAQRIMLARHDCPDCEKPEIVARHAAAVVQRRSEPLAPWFPLTELAACAPLAEKPAAAPSVEAPQLAERPRQPVLLAVYGARVPEKIRHSVSLGARQYLELIGQPVQEFRSPIHADAPRSSLRPQQQAARLLDIELQVNDRKTSVSEVLVRLSDVKDTRQTTFRCANLKECTPAALVQQVRLHVGTLMDYLDTPAQPPLEPGAPELCLPAPLCAPSVAQAKNMKIPPVQTPPADPQPDLDGATSEPATAPIVPSPTPPITPCPGMNRARKLKIGGGTLIGIGSALAVAAVVPTVLSTVTSRCQHPNGNEAQFCDPLPSPQNLWPVAGVGYGLGALSIGSGIGLLAWSRKESRMEALQGGTTCPH